MLNNYDLVIGPEGDLQLQSTTSPVRMPFRELNKIKVLLVTVSSDMAGANIIDVEKHIRMVKEALEKARFRRRFEFMAVRETQLKDLRRKLLNENPHIVHFLGHGDREGLEFRNEFVTTEALADLFRNLPGRIWCVLLNACYSEAQAKAIYESIDCVIGMRDRIGENDSAKFSEGFYDAFGAGKPFDKAFKIGRSAIARPGQDDSENLKLFYRPKAVSFSNASDKIRRLKARS